MITDSDQPFQRKIRSFVMRATRMTDSQKKSLGQNWDQFGLTQDQGSLV
ncbi:MAG: tRNA (guanine-N7-)-methyltransferase, partial [Reinekea sp.]